MRAACRWLNLTASYDAIVTYDMSIVVSSHIHLPYSMIFAGCGSDVVSGDQYCSNLLIICAGFRWVGERLVQVRWMFTRGLLRHRSWQSASGRWPSHSISFIWTASSPRSVWHNITYSFNTNCQTTGVHGNKTIFRPSYVTFSKMCIFHQNLGWLPSFERIFLLFLYVEPFGYDSSPNECTVTFFCKIWGNFPIIKNKGIRRWIQSWDIQTTPYPELFAGSEI